MNMIIKKIQGDILTTEDKIIIFGINTEGDNDWGFPGHLSRTIWPELTHTGGNKLGEILEKKNGEKKYYGIVCYSLAENGWRFAPKILRETLDSMDIQESASIIMIGAELAGTKYAPLVHRICESFEQSNKKLTLYIY